MTLRSPIPTIGLSLHGMQPPMVMEPEIIPNMPLILPQDSTSSELLTEPPEEAEVEEEPSSEEPIQLVPNSSIQVFIFIYLFILTNTPDGDVKLQWEIRDPDIVLKLSVQTTGWISVGVSLGSTMIDADYWTGWVDGTNVYLFDTWSTAKVLPDRDIDIGGTDDLKIFRGEEANGWTTIVFSRPLQTTDQNDVPITDSTMVRNVHIVHITRSVRPLGPSQLQ